jgi:hypothetical protein
VLLQLDRVDADLLLLDLLARRRVLNLDSIE